MLFSLRNGYITVPSNMQPDTISETLRNSLWNEVIEWAESNDLRALCYSIWKNFYKLPTDKIPFSQSYGSRNYNPAWQLVREKYFNYQWHMVYSFIEFLFTLDRFNQLSKKINSVLISETAAYRVFKNKLIQVTDSNELSSLCQGVSYVDEFSPVSQHILSSLNLLSNRENPDYRNSIKEAISAVEAIGKIITDKPSATLVEILKTLESKHGLHSALKKGYLSLYAYTSDSNGIRHALMEESNLTQADAKYFLLSCTSFVNYLKSFISDS